MRFAPKIFLLLLLVAQAGLALDINTTEGQFYKQCVITQVEQDALRFTHEDGVGKIPYEKLPTDLQKQYFDASKVALYHQQVEIARQAAAIKAADEIQQRKQATAIAAQNQRQKEVEQLQQEEEQRAITLRQEKQRIAAEERHKTIAATWVVIYIIGSWVIVLFIYFIPSIVGRHKSNATAIFVLNLFLGWTFVGWVLALVWACTKDSAMDALARHRMDITKDGRRYLE